VFFCPSNNPGEKILGACVGLPSGEIYSASAHSKEVYIKQKGHFARPAAKPSTVKELKNASVCFYGQKAGSLSAVAERGLIKYITDWNEKQNETRARKKLNGEPLDDADADASSRFYNLAGIPMMVKLIDHRVKAAKNIDAVFEVRGQKPHDVVPGAFLALVGGAVMWSLDDNAYVTPADLEKALLKPSDKSMRYIIACTKELCQQILPLLKPLAKSV
jgi:hypothetical protein